jgi:hypothetical protein
MNPDPLTPSAQALRHEATRLHDMLQSFLEAEELPDDYVLARIRAFLDQFTVGQWVDGEKLGSIKELHEKLHTGRTTITNWTARRHFNNCPHPVAEFGNGPVYHVEDFAKWWEAWIPGKKAGYLDSVDSDDTDLKENV